MDKLTAVINKRVQRLFANTQYVFDYVDDDLLAKKLCKWPLWRQLFHMLHSMDQWFINPFNYLDPREDGFLITALNTEVDMAPMKKSELSDYYDSIKAKIQTYLSTLTDEELAASPECSPLSRLDLILAQFIHIMYHVGLIHGCILIERGEIPEYFSNSAPVWPVGIRKE
jgi:hypothetical protein